MLDSASTPLAGCQAGAFVGKPVANSWDPSTPIHGSFSSSAYAHIADNSSIVPVHKSIPVAATTARLWTVNGKSRQLYACSASPHVSDAKASQVSFLLQLPQPRSRQALCTCICQMVPASAMLRHHSRTVFQYALLQPAARLHESGVTPLPIDSWGCIVHVRNFCRRVQRMARRGCILHPD